MPDLNKISPAALKAAMQGGTDAWGQHGSATKHVRYAEPIVPKSRKKCWCGCEGKRTYKGMANGVCLTTACHMGILRWVKTGNVRTTAQDDAARRAAWNVLTAPPKTQGEADAISGMFDNI